MNKIALVVSVGFWGMVFVVSKDVLNYMGTTTLSFLRCFIAFMCLMPIMVYKKIDFRSMLKFRYVVYGLIGCAAHYLLLNRAVALTTPGISSLLQSLIPIYGLILGRWILDEPAGYTKVIGGAVSIFGIFIASWQAINSGENTSLDGIITMIVAVFCWSLYSALSKKYDRNTDSIFLTVAMLFYGLLFMAPFTVYELIYVQGITLNLVGTSELAFIGICATAATVTLWNFALKKIDVGTASVALNLIPIIGIVCSTLFGERISGLQWIGSGIVLMGIIITTTNRKSIGNHLE